tara:strand:- start:425 stop:1564 length:1140 start_codon:yes stop_codon:yes gene_type:complete
MKKKSQFLYKIIEDKTIIWFESSNKYLVLENTAAAILKKLNKGMAVLEIATSLSKKIAVPLAQTIDFILDLEKRIYKHKSDIESETAGDSIGIKFPKTFNYVRHYKVNNIVFKVSYLTERELSLVHPKFIHLVIDNPKKIDYEFDVFTQNKITYLFVEKELIGGWSNKDIHYFQGKLSMQLVQKINQKEEDEWIGVFHASALGNGEKAILFLGDSGNGKSTSLALLQAHGFNCIADDFVPIDLKNLEVYSFPAAISVKKNSLKTLLPLYPELGDATEYNLKQLNKVVRYLKPNNKDFSTHLPCRDLVFIKYKKNTGISCDKISKIAAFQQLVPDAWLSPRKENAKVFLDWFENLNCFQLTYSDTDQLVNKVSKLFKDDL